MAGERRLEFDRRCLRRPWENKIWSFLLHSSLQRWRFNTPDKVAPIVRPQSAHRSGLYSLILPHSLFKRVTHLISHSTSGEEKLLYWYQGCWFCLSRHAQRSEEASLARSQLLHVSFFVFFACESRQKKVLGGAKDVVSSTHIYGKCVRVYSAEIWSGRDGETKREKRREAKTHWDRSRWRKKKHGEKYKQEEVPFFLKRRSIEYRIFPSALGVERTAIHENV